MSVHEYRFLLSEQAVLRDMIAQAPADSIITTMSLRYRLQQVERELEEYPDNASTRVVNARLTFSGKPVVGSRGIRADFGSGAVKAFADAVTRVGASQHAALAPRGPVPGGADYELLITGVAPGSFGFQVEAASGQLALAGEPTPVELAIERVKGILEASMGTDEDLGDAIGETDDRALGSVRAFLKTLVDDEAVCDLEFGGDVFSFRDADQVRRSERRLSRDNIRERTVTLQGRFQGYLPNSRRAEFLVSEADVDFLEESTGTVINVHVDPCVEEDVRINEILEQEVSVESRTRRVGSGQPRHLFRRVGVR